ncbi:beta-propeller domain-containing protein [Nonomuraea angiospora]|uniref:Secreted protein with C-terminal beta-propeller domain n=1 Tax=Nonomuraea angiospora TaxID=46172 RepID=A0ABR9MAS6_9ACTN|nr:beta-propeller domain-containing protein [Nonomuraea angiospora]MBE1590018.1 putative secreted protein with C-terminal beta-propeller domain [Nonomuraea angiospora]
MKTLIRTAATVAALATAAVACTSTTAGTPPKPRASSLGAIRLVAYTGCDDLLSGLREHAAQRVTPWGFDNVMPLAYMEDSARSVTANAKTSTPEHSTTNVHEAGVDEPDVVKTDGDRVITVKDGVLRIIDTATRKVTGSLKLTEGENGPGVPADLLVSGDRALVLMRGGDIMYKRMAGFAPQGDTRYVLVDLSGAPKVLSTIKPQGSYVDARMVGSTVRLVTRSQPDIAFPEFKEDVSEAERVKRNQAVVRQAPADAWLPKIEITDASGAVRKDSVKCERISHPADYTGTSLLTVHTIDLAQGVTAAGTDPISLAADGDIVYGTGSSLYVASNPRWWMPVVISEPAVETPATTPSSGEAAPAVEPTPTDPPVPDTPTPSPEPTIPPEETEVHRFDIGSPGAPSYVASGKVPGRLLNQYSLSEYDGHLRVATTLTSPDGKNSSSAVYVLKADTLARTGEVGGLGEGERIYSVRFIGPVGYCVTFRQVDPLYTLDLRDAAAPKVTGELKITGYSAYLHPGAEGRLIGIGQEASEKGRTLGTQVSLFDVSDPAGPRRLSQLFQKDSGSTAEWDPHAFLYWPKTGLAVIPLTQQTESGGLVLKIDDSGVTKLGMIKHPGKDEYQAGIQRALVIGDSIWTLSYDGIQVNDAATLAQQAWIPLR